LIRIGFGIKIRVGVTVVSDVISIIVVARIAWYFGLLGRFCENFLNAPLGRISYTPPRRDRWTSGW
jgi:hypothetical protein